MFLVLLFIVILSTSSFLFLRFREKLFGPQLTTVQEEKKVIVPKEKDPIKKSFIPEGGVSYEILGSFTELTKPEDDNLLQGKFVVKADPLKRELKVILGHVNGDILLGTYEGIFSASKSTWEMKPAEEVLRQVRIGEEVILDFRMPTNNKNSVRDYVSKNEKVMDALTLDFQSGEYKYTPPTDFLIYSESVGIIRPKL